MSLISYKEIKGIEFLLIETCWIDRKGEKKTNLRKQVELRLQETLSSSTEARSVG